MDGDIEIIEGIGPVYGKQLRSVGISWVKELLEQGGSANGRKQLVEKTGLTHDQILKWVNHADLLRIKGMTPDWAELLEEAGVDTVKELKTRVAENLHEKLKAVNPKNPQGSYARTVPDLATVQAWIDQATSLTPKVTY